MSWVRHGLLSMQIPLGWGSVGSTACQDNCAVVPSSVLELKTLFRCLHEASTDGEGSHHQVGGHAGLPVLTSGTWAAFGRRQLLSFSTPELKYFVGLNVLRLSISYSLVCHQYCCFPSNVASLFSQRPFYSYR